MYLSVQKRKNGEEYYSFTYIGEDGKRRKVPRSEMPALKSRAEAEAWGKSQEAIYASKKAYIAQKLAWKTQYYDFEALLELYTDWAKGQAPNSWKNNIGWLSNWVFPFFLNEKKSGNVNDWHLHYQEFRDYLTKDDIGLKVSKRTKLAASTVNNIIKALNTFITCLGKYNKIDSEKARLKCEPLAEHLLGRRTYKDIIPLEEMKLVHAKLTTIHKPAADFFYVLWHTGMRFNELYSLPITALFRGKADNKSFNDEMTKCGIEYVGYIYLESQAANDDQKREANGHLKRKPLKSCKEIHPRHARTIPIRTLEVWNILALRYKAGLEALMTKKYGPAKEDYLFFDDLEWNKAQNGIKAAYTALKLPPKQYHCCRHTYATMLVGETKSFFLTRAITGHRKDKSFEKYLHVFEQMAIENKRSAQEIDLITIPGA